MTQENLHTRFRCDGGDYLSARWALTRTQGSFLTDVVFLVIILFGSALVARAGDDLAAPDAFFFLGISILLAGGWVFLWCQRVVVKRAHFERLTPPHADIDVFASQRSLTLDWDSSASPVRVPWEDWDYYIETRRILLLVPRDGVRTGPLIIPVRSAAATRNDLQSVIDVHIRRHKGGPHAP